MPMFSRLSRTIRTFTFRLAMVYVGLFSLSVILLFTFIYTFAANYLQAQVTDALRTRYSFLLNEYRENGSVGLEARIKELIAQDDEGNEIYLIANKDYEKLSGNLNTWPLQAREEGNFEKDGRWVRFHIEGTRSTPEGLEVKAILIPLSKWRWLLIGESLQSSEKIEQIIIQTFWASLLLTLAMAFAGAIIMTRSVMGRINIINRSVANIMRGHLSARIPYAKGGDEFDELSLNLNQMLDRIERLLLSLSQFANNIAHDLRSPLNRIINRLDAGLRSIESKNPAHKLLAKNIEDMEGLIATFNAILKISELEARPESVSFEPCDLSAILGNLCELYVPYAEEKRIEFAADVEPGVPLVVGEKHLLSQAFANVIDNAIKFTPEGGRITLSCRTREGAVEVAIGDSGPGIPTEYREKVFEKFFRLEQSRNTKGNGLGLSLVAAIARIHRADILLENNAPGLRLTLRFPLA